MFQKIKKSVVRACILFIIGLSSLVLVDLFFIYQASDRMHRSAVKMEKAPIALVLGTNKYYRGIENPYYRYRINAAAELYHSGKINGLLLSGDNSQLNYNEPQMMKDDLLELGVPESAITLDYAGFRTLDSIIRAKKVFKQDKLIIISQKFHCERALYIADHYDIDAEAYLADEVLLRRSQVKVRIRECLARNKAMLDLYITQQQPKFLGPEEKVNLVSR